MSMTDYAWHDDAWRLAQAAVARGAHALLIAGARGLGKGEFALRLAAGYLCGSRSGDGVACGKCASCHWLNAGTHPDFALIEPRTEESEEDKTSSSMTGRGRPITVDQIRQLADFMTLTAHGRAGKTVVIRPAESMHAAAANALLKNLEEPPPGVLFLLVTDRSALLLPTVRSRCLQIPIRLHDRAMAERWLAREGCAEPALQLALCGGAPVEALAISRDTTWGRRREFLGRLAGTSSDAVALAESVRDVPPPVVLGWLQKWTFDLLFVSACGRVRYHVDMHDKLGACARRSSPLALSRIHRELLSLQRHAQHPLNPRLFLEQMLIGYGRAFSSGARA